jgi:asparagine synthase (glutamine-hydrolysing)
MPGIVGIITSNAGEQCQRLIRIMVSSMMHEPFYVSGEHVVPEMGVYAGWVAHENSFASQVFSNERQDTSLLFSGECFFDSQTSANLDQRRQTDGVDHAAPLMHFYEREGVRFFGKLNGLFSGLLIDRRQRKVFLFNDRYGVERIYWHQTKDAFYFASEAKALLRVLPVLRGFDAEGVAHFFAFGCTPMGRTLFREIQLLPPGSLWRFENGHCHKGKHFSPEFWESQVVLPIEDFTEEFEATFKKVISRYFRGAGRIGISLTAGLDCRLIMACHPRRDDDPICYTFAGPKRDTLDVRIARRVAKTAGLSHCVIRLRPDFFSDFASHVDRTVYITDGTLGVLGAHEIYFNRQARALAPVRLTGVFGGEILRGVSFLKPLGLTSKLLNPDFASAVRSAGEQRSNQHLVSDAAFRDIPEKRFGPPAASRSQLTFRTPYLDNDLVALAYRVPEAMRSSPSIALHMIKANNSLLAGISTDRGLSGQNNSLTSLLRAMFYELTFKLDYRYNEGLPHSLSFLDPLFRQLELGPGVLGLHKFLHYRTWLRSEVASYVEDVIDRMQANGSPFWNSNSLPRLARDHIEGRMNYLGELNAVLTLEAVERLLLQNLPCEPDNGKNANSSDCTVTVTTAD